MPNRIIHEEITHCSVKCFHFRPLCSPFCGHPNTDNRRINLPQLKTDFPDWCPLSEVLPDSTKVEASGISILVDGKIIGTIKDWKVIDKVKEAIHTIDAESMKDWVSPEDFPLMSEQELIKAKKAEQEEIYRREDLAAITGTCPLVEVEMAKTFVSPEIEVTSMYHLARLQKNLQVETTTDKDQINELALQIREVMKAQWDLSDDELDEALDNGQITFDAGGHRIMKDDGITTELVPLIFKGKCS